MVLHSLGVGEVVCLKNMQQLCLGKKINRTIFFFSAPCAAWGYNLSLIVRGCETEMRDGDDDEIDEFATVDFI